MSDELIKQTFIKLEERGYIAPIGECSYCDNERSNNNTFFPPHKSFSTCRSYNGGRNHCTCDGCF